MDQLYINRKVSQDRKYHTKNYQVDLPEILLWGATGSIDDVKKEAKQFINYNVSFDADVVEHITDRLQDCIKTAPTVPLSYEEVIADHLVLSSSSGSPWKVFSPSKKDVLNTLGVDVFVDMLYQIESDVINNIYVPTCTWDCFSKSDKYKQEKLKNDRLRTVQSADMMYLCVLTRWVYYPFKKLCRDYEHFMLAFDNTDYITRVTFPFSDKYTLGLDGTGFDRTVPVQIIAFVMNLLMSHTNAHPNLIHWVTEVAAYGPLLFPDGTLMERYGGNPSGILLTGLINSVYSEFLKTQVYKALFNVPVNQLKSHVDWLITGDDSLDGFYTPPPLEKLLWLFNSFGTVFKLEVLASGQCYPPGKGTHVPFLARMSLFVGGYALTVPIEYRRNLGWYHTLRTDITLTEQYASWVGIRESLMPYYVAHLLDPTYPVPFPVIKFFEQFDEFRSKLIQRNLIPVKPEPMGLAQALVVSGAVSLETSNGGRRKVF